MIKVCIGREIFPIGQKFTTFGPGDYAEYQEIEFRGPKHAKIFKEVKSGQIIKYNKGIVVEVK